MTRKMKADLRKAGKMIADNKAHCICSAMGKVTGCSSDWAETKEAKMIDPDAFFWWGYKTMGVDYDSAEARNARLLGIAMMVTMPEDMIDPNL